MHYMADISDKLNQTFRLVEEGLYFTINRPHQYGKSTIQTELANKLNGQTNYLALNISFEPIDYEVYQDKKVFIDTFLELLAECFELYAYDELSEFVLNEKGKLENFKGLSVFIGKLVRKTNQHLVLIIDEVDRSSNNQLFLDFLAILRDRYLRRSQIIDYPTFLSVVLCGVYDVKKIKQKINPETKFKYNSPWNIAMDYDVDLNLSTNEIASMLQVYADEKQRDMDIPELSEQLFYYTSGHPFLTSYLCKIIDEELLPKRKDKEWSREDVDGALKVILNKDNTNFQSLIKNLENHPDLYHNVSQIILAGDELTFNIDDPIIDVGMTCGIFGRKENKVIIHNRVYEQRLYNYMTSKLRTSSSIPTWEGKYIENGQLDVKRMLLGFQTFMQENYSGKNEAFLEKHGTLLFLAFVKPIINGKGFDFKEVQISEERRLDVVLTCLNQKYIVELKRWRGEKAHQEGLDQLSDYLDRQNLREGYLLIYDFKATKKAYKHQLIQHKDKVIFAAWV